MKAKVRIEAPARVLAPGATLALAALFWAAVTVTAVALRPLLPVDETRYLSVAWEMWWRGNLLVPYLNGAPYADKPPLLFWMIQAVWALTGVSETAARLLAGVFSLASVAAAAWLARLLWPRDGEIAAFVPVVLSGVLVFAVYGTLVMFDMPLTLFVLLGLVAAVKAAGDERRRWWALFAVALGAGILAKGPVAVLHLLPAPLLAPLWWPGERAPAWRRWYRRLAVAVAAGAALALAWAIPAAIAGGADYARAIFWSQTAGRIGGVAPHARPWWFYLAILPAMVYPWGWVPALWRRLRAGAGNDSGLRFCLAWALPPFLVLMAVSGKQLHYLLPLVPAFALAVSRLLAGSDLGVRMRDAVVPALLPMVVGLAIVLAPALSSLLLQFFPTVAVPSWVADMPPQWGVALIAGAVLFSLVGGTRRWSNVLAIAANTAMIFLTLHAAGTASAFRIYDLNQIAAYLGAHPEAPIVYNKDYEGEFGFLGRLKRPVRSLGDDDMAAWIAGARGGLLVLRYRELPGYVSGPPVLEQQYRGQRLGIWTVPAKVR